MDGGSTDGSAAIIEKYASQLSYWQSCADAGQADALNQGFARATGDLLLWINSDDMLMPGVLHKLARLATAVDAPRLWMANCLHFSMQDGRLDTRGSNIPRLHQQYTLSHIDYIIQPATCFTRAAWSLAGPLRADMHYAFDWEWFLRAQKAGVAMQAVEEVWAMYRLHAGHKSGGGAAKKRQQEILNVYQTYNPRMAQLYQLLMAETLDYNSATSLNIRRWLKATGRQTAYGYVLKYRYPRKYKAFTGEEVTHAAMML